MKGLIVIIIFILTQSTVIADEREEAIKGIQRAILSYPEVKKAKKKVEKKIIQYIPVKKETAGVIGGLALSASKGYVDTKVIKRMNVDVYGAKLRPNIRHDFKNKETKGTVDIGWDF